MGRSVQIIPLRSLTTGGPLHAAPSSRVCVSPDWTRRPALPGDAVRKESASENYPVIVSNCQVPGEPLAPHPGYSFGAAALQTTHSGRGSKEPSARRDPLICPTSPSNYLERSAVSPATHTVGGPGGPPSPLPPQPRE
jgi:hypothetical protein